MTSDSRLDFGGDQDHGADKGFFTRIFLLLLHVQDKTTLRILTITQEPVGEFLREILRRVARVHWQRTVRFWWQYGSSSGDGNFLTGFLPL